MVFAFFFYFFFFLVLLLRFIIDRIDTNNWNHAKHWKDLCRIFLIGVFYNSKKKKIIIIMIFFQLTIHAATINENLPKNIELALSLTMK